MMDDMSTYNNMVLRAILNESVNSRANERLSNEIKPMDFKVCIQRKISFDKAHSFSNRQ